MRRSQRVHCVQVRGIKNRLVSTQASAILQSDPVDVSQPNNSAAESTTTNPWTWDLLGRGPRQTRPVIETRDLGAPTPSTRLPDLVELCSSRRRRRRRCCCRRRHAFHRRLDFVQRLKDTFPSLAFFGELRFIFGKRTRTPHVIFYLTRGKQKQSFKRGLCLLHATNLYFEKT